MTDNARPSGAKHLPLMRRFITVVLVGQVLLVLTACTHIQSTRTTAGAGGIPIAFYSVGSSDTALLFVHGWSCDRSYWRQQISAFADDYRVVAIDLGGHGESPATRDDWSIESFGQDVAAVATAIDAQRLVLVGHSMSGPVVLDAAQRLGDRVTGIIGVDTLKDVSLGPIDSERAATMFTTSATDFPVRMDALARRAFFTDDTSTELIEQIARDMAAGDPVVGGNAGIALVTFDVRAALGELDRIPLVLINADYTPTNIDALNTAYPESRVVIISGAGHFLMLERPAEFNAALRQELTRLLDSK